MVLNTEIRYKLSAEVENMTKNDIWKKAIVLSIIVMFLGVGIYPVIASHPKQTPNILTTDETDYGIDTEPKEYLFQTIVDIINNPEINLLFETTKNDGECICYNYDIRSVFQKIFFKKPLLIFTMIFSKPSITHTYLETNYNRGCEVKNILGEDNSNMIVNSIEITNTEFFSNLNDIIMDNEDIYDKITTLATLNSQNENSSIICRILNILLLGYLIRAGFVGFLGVFFEGSIISKISGRQSASPPVKSTINVPDLNNWSRIPVISAVESSFSFGLLP